MKVSNLSWVVVTFFASTALANETFCRAPVLKQARTQLAKSVTVQKLEVDSVAMGENFHTFVLKLQAAPKKGAKFTELYDAKVDSDCKILELEAQPDSQRPL